MIATTYYVILLYFVAGGIGFYFINRRRDRQTAMKSYVKFITYFLIINVLFFSIVLFPMLFRVLAVIIVAGGMIEMVGLFRFDGFSHQPFFTVSTILFIVAASGFFVFSGMNADLVLFSFLVLSIFDSFSQITGQLGGKKKLFPRISPNKTVGGLVGGVIVALGSAYLLRNLYTSSAVSALLMGAGIVLFAFLGDLAASVYKRKYGAKDFSRAIPGHGGILDRFDSLIAGGAWVALCGSFCIV